MSIENYRRFTGLGFDDFREMAKNETLSRYEKIGFPDDYRKGYERAIFSDIQAKLSALRLSGKRIVDIGAGCSDLPHLLIADCQAKGNDLILIDSAEMLALLPDEPGLSKIAAYYPSCPNLFAQYAGQVDAILVYSVIQYVFAESNLWDFIDLSLLLLSEGGEMLIGDIPNVSMRKRFLSSERGIAYHKTYASTEEAPKVKFNTIERQQIDDSIIFAILGRVRAAGFDAFVLPQRDDLPMANRREDILIRRP